MDIASSSRTLVSNSLLRATRTLSSSSTPSVDGARMMMSLSNLELDNIKSSLTTVPSTVNTLSSLSGLLPCSTVVPLKFYGTPLPELDVVSLTSLPEETPLVLATPPRRMLKVRELTFTTDGTDKSSLSTLKDYSPELRYTPSRSLPSTPLPLKWNSSTPREPRNSNSSLDLRCVNSVEIRKILPRAS